MNAGFFAYEDDETGCTTVVFGTPQNVLIESIGNDDYTDFAIEAKNRVEDALEDIGYLCEDYLVSTEKSVEDCRSICVKAGLVELPGLKNCGWS